MTAVPEIQKELQVDGETLCRYLEWDSEFFGFRIARIEKIHLSTQDLLSILAWCRQERIDCLYFLAESSDSESIWLAEDYKFHLADVRVTLERKVDPEIAGMETNSTFGIRPAQASDLDVLRHIAGTSIQETRFYFDRRFPRERCDQLYQTWIEVSMKGYADAVLVAEAGVKPIGFITCKVGNLHVGQIGLLGVRPGWEGKGIGVALVNAGLHWFAGRDMERVIVITQGRNIPAQRLYQRCGFLISVTQLWYHRWFDVKY